LTSGAGREREKGTMKRTTILTGATLSLIAAVSVTLFAKETRDGPSALFKEYCAKCHGEDGTGKTPKGTQLRARDFTDAEWWSAKSDADMIKAVTTGGEEMPAFGKKLTAEQIETLVKDDVRGFAKRK
jgi:mono/diheme cytochrome c family protein